MPVKTVELLGGSEKLQWTQGAQALEVTLPAGTACQYAYALRMTPAEK